MDEAALHELLTEHGGEVKSLTIRIKNEEPGGAASGQHKVPTISLHVIHGNLLLTAEKTRDRAGASRRT